MVVVKSCLQEPIAFRFISRELSQRIRWNVAIDEVADVGRWMASLSVTGHLPAPAEGAQIIHLKVSDDETFRPKRLDPA